MDKKRHKTFVKFISEEHGVFKPGEIGVIIKYHRTYPQWDNVANGRVESRGARVRSINGQKEADAWEGDDYVRIETTPALEILYGKYVEKAPTIIKEEELHGKGYRYSTKRNRRKV